MTNADVIREMRYDRMAKFLAKVYSDSTAVFSSDHNECMNCNAVIYKCEKCAAEWLEKDAYKGESGLWYDRIYTTLPEISEMINNLELGKATVKEQVLLSAFLKCYINDIYSNRKKNTNLQGE